MKKITVFVMAAFLPLLLSAQDVTWMNILKQKQLGSGSEIMEIIPPNGTGPSLLPLEEGGAVFELWTIKQSTSEADVPYLLDSKFVDAYEPTASMTVITEDPYDGEMPRTRADRPFGIKLEVGGLITEESGGSLGSSQVALVHKAATFTPGDHEPDPLPEDALVSQNWILGNGAALLPFTGHNLSQVDPYKAEGIETFTVYPRADYQEQETQLDKVQIQIWPIAQAEIQGIDSGKVYSKAPEGQVILTNLYPDSMTWMQVYKGAPALGTEGVIVNSGSLTVDQDIPKDGELDVTGLGPYLDSDGEWTLEVITQTPFGIERLGHISFEVDTTIEVHGALIGSE